MLKAEQLALIQEANQQLLAIRQLELEYYTTVFSNLGTVAALVAGFSMSSITSLDANSFDCSEIWRALFWFSSAVSLGASLHCVLSTTFATMFGTGLALRGPTGSMVRAVDGMMEEKGAIFNSFILAIASFQIMGVCICWIIMPYYAAAVFTAISLVASYFWYRYCTRIFLRFKIHNENLAWQDSRRRGNSDAAPTEDDVRRVREVTDDENAGASGTVSQPVEKKKGFNLFKKKKEPMASMDEIGDSDSVMSGGIDSGLKKTDITGVRRANSSSFQVNPTKVWMEGYLTKKGNTKNPLNKDPWARRYFVLKGSNLFYYNSREVFENDPSKTVKNRPIDLLGYSVAAHNAESPPYLLELVPDSAEADGKRIWFFRCDTISELEEWVEAFQRATGTIH